MRILCVNYYLMNLLVKRLLAIYSFDPLVTKSTTVLKYFEYHIFHTVGPL